MKTTCLENYYKFLYLEENVDVDALFSHVKYMFYSLYGEYLKIMAWILILILNSMSLKLTRLDHGPVRTGIVVKKPNFEPDFRFLNLNRSKSGFGSVLGIQNREPNRNRTKKNFKFFWLNRIEPEPNWNRNRPVQSKKFEIFFDR